VTPLHLPRASLKCIPWRDRGGETRTKVAQRGRLSAADGIKDGAGGKSERRQAMQDHAPKTGLGTDARICWARQRCRWSWDERALRTDMKRVVVAGEAVDQRLRGQRSVVDDPVGRAVLRGGHVLRWGGDAAGETLSCELSGQVEACGLRGGSRVI
jgi:hypothetical protein